MTYQGGSLGGLLGSYRIGTIRVRHLHHDSAFMDYHRKGFIWDEYRIVILFIISNNLFGRLY